ncbi:MAG: twin-arginine translocase TatA/TatE family subunit [Anaerolineaceae bacterium]|nr:twin-arginine translocase TatA/TatE family subunit [Anaerolineaceae bacterium]
MKFFNFGGLEIIFILVIMIIFLGPDQVAKLAKNLGSLIRKITQSEFWGSIWRTSREIRDLPRTLADETGLQERLNEIQNSTKGIIADVGQIRKDLDEEQELHRSEIRKTVTELNRANEEMKKRAAAGNPPNESSKNLE